MGSNEEMDQDELRLQRMTRYWKPLYRRGDHVDFSSDHGECMCDQCDPLALRRAIQRTEEDLKRIRHQRLDITYGEAIRKMWQSLTPDGPSVCQHLNAEDVLSLDGSVLLAWWCPDCDKRLETPYTMLKDIQGE